MAINFTPDDVASGFNLTKLNSNFDKVETALADALSRSGNGPNQMNADIDMNSNDLLNVKQIDTNVLVLDGEVVQKVDLVGAMKASNALSEIAALGLQAQARDNIDAASEAQGIKADTAIQPADVGRLDFTHSSTYLQGSVGLTLDKVVFVTNAPFNAKMDGTDDSAALQAAINFVSAPGVVFIPAGLLGLLSGITMKPGVDVIGAGRNATYIIPLANSITLFNNINVSSAGSNFELANFSIHCEVGTARTGVQGVKAVFSNRIVLRNINFYGCLRNFEFDRGGLHSVIDCVAAGTATLKTGDIWWGSSDDAAYGGVFSCIRNLRIENSGTGVQSPAVKFRRAVAIYGDIQTNNSTYTGDFVVVENDCQGLDFRLLGTAYGRSLVFQKGPGVDARPIFNTFRLEADQNNDASLVMTAGRQNTIEVMITSSNIATSQTAIVLNGSAVERNNIYGRVSGYFGALGTGCTMINTVGTNLDLHISGCDRGIVDGGGNTHADISGDVSEAIVTPVSGSFGGAGNNGTGNRIHDLKGYTGAGAVPTPAVPATGVPVTNNTGHDVQVFFQGGTITTLTVRGQGLIYSTGRDPVLKAGDSIAWNGTVAPTWNWIAF